MKCLIKTLLISFILFVSCKKHEDNVTRTDNRAINIELKNINDSIKYIIPTNGLKTILFLGGKDSKDAKEEWYKNMVDDRYISDSVNLVFIVQLSNVPNFASNSSVESNVKEEIRELSKKYPQHKRTYFYYDWGYELSDYYDSDIDRVTLVLIDVDIAIINILEWNYSASNFDKVLDFL